LTKEETTMGEAKRRGPRAPREANRLPEFIFAREKWVEEANDFLLAGKLLTDIPHDAEPSEHDKTLITEFIQGLTSLVAREPDLEEAGAWRNGVKPPDGFAPPYPDDAVNERLKRCIVVGVRVDRNAPDGFIRIDDSAMADIMGRQ
jgi:hypothetical protein